MKKSQLYKNIATHIKYGTNQNGDKPEVISYELVEVGLDLWLKVKTKNRSLYYTAEEISEQGFLYADMMPSAQQARVDLENFVLKIIEHRVETGLSKIINEPKIEMAYSSPHSYWRFYDFKMKDAKSHQTIRFLHNPAYFSEYYDDTIYEDDSEKTFVNEIDGWVLSFQEMLMFAPWNDEEAIKSLIRLANDTEACQSAYALKYPTRSLC